jgi:hypothetical protein
MLDEELSVVYDPDDDAVCYWVAWAEQDNKGNYRKPKLYRVFRDERRKPKGEPISEPMSREEAYKELRKLQLLLGGRASYE